VFSQLYGQTECYPVLGAAQRPIHDPKTPDLFLSCGFPIAACQVKDSRRRRNEVATARPAKSACARRM
jgi:fatty-acyl-CoA synthase